jgi:hypothetical protein
MSARVETGRDATRYSQRSAQVWAMLALAMVVFLGVCGALTIGVSDLLGSITIPESASIRALPPSPLGVQRHGTTSPEFITGTTGLQEGDVATSGPGGQAFITLFGDSGSIQMYFNTSIEMERMRASRFFQGGKEIALFLHTGTIVLATGEPGDYASASYTLSTDQAEVEVAPGAKLRVRVEEEQGTQTTQVVVNSGHATLRSRGKRIELGPEEMAWVSGPDAPQGPAPAQVDLIRNGSFEEQPTSSSEEIAEGGLGTAAWLPLREPGGVDSNLAGYPQAGVGITEEVNLKAAVITGYPLGAGSANKYIRVGITQDINQPASFFNSIELSATVKLVNQAIPTGGPVADVYPLTIRIVYSDQTGANHEWKRSFYFEGPPPDPADNTAIKIGQGRWTTTAQIEEERAKASTKYQVPSTKSGGSSLGTENLVLGTSLFMLKSPNQVQDIAVINAIEIYGYGTQYQSWITGISLLAR